MEAGAEGGATGRENVTPEEVKQMKSDQDAGGEDHPREYRVVYVLGSPGSGKSTQCSKISSEFGFSHLSAGDLLQKEVESGSEEGKMIRDLKKEGKLVPSETVVKLLQQAMCRSESKKFLIDGFPRNEENLAAAENIMKIEPDVILFFDCSEPESIRRLLSRNQGRADDNAETIRSRLKVYSESTVPVINYYNSKGKVRKIDAERPVEDVYKSVKEVLSGIESKGQ
ncbi:UMP-CMP kinase 3-like isoform X1 [Rhodamnia argentea]|uniref:adenylate kinase n=1 Tax=Rhodamnia argentea TaxID=178133 RepID=A0A8B8QLB2_9MYRT|nr:UMP-CMP kinase 3-like isoform X1 [Rhodamnia argentea]XP_048128642.1 UMP-CMP kinase 3-like isoform X1 [Rhodamnia argentea]